MLITWLKQLTLLWQQMMTVAFQKDPKVASDILQSILIQNLQPLLPQVDSFSLFQEILLKCLFWRKIFQRSKFPDWCQLFSRIPNQQQSQEHTLHQCSEACLFDNNSKLSWSSWDLDQSKVHFHPGSRNQPTWLSFREFLPELKIKFENFLD